MRMRQTDGQTDGKMAEGL